jgi:hypothetical protein
MDTECHKKNVEVVAGGHLVVQFEVVDPGFDLKCVERVVEDGRLDLHFDERQGEVAHPDIDLEHVGGVAEEVRLALHLEKR